MGRKEGTTPPTPGTPGLEEPSYCLYNLRSRPVFSHDDVFEDEKDDYNSDDDESWYPEEEQEDQDEEDDYDSFLLHWTSTSSSSSQDETDVCVTTSTTSTQQLSQTTRIALVLYLIMHLLARAAFWKEAPVETPDTRALLVRTSRALHSNADFRRRAAQVPWGGKRQAKWWRTAPTTRSLYYNANKQNRLEAIPGATQLLYPHYRAVMAKQQRLWPLLFGNDNIDKMDLAVTQSIMNTLAWRETYKPWQVNRAILQDENVHGWVYARGLARSSHNAMVWLRLGRSYRSNPAASNNHSGAMRAIVQTIDVAVGKSMARHSRRGSVGGRVNVVIDAKGYAWPQMGYDLALLVDLLDILAKHYPGRLGTIFLCNMQDAPAAQAMYALLQACCLEKETQDKIQVLTAAMTTTTANDSSSSSLTTTAKPSIAQQLEAVVPLKHIPEWLGGKDKYTFRARRYYASYRMIKEDHSDIEEKTTLELIPQVASRGYYLN